MFSSLTFQRKIGLLVAAAVAGVAVMALVSTFKTRAQINEGRKGQLVTAVQTAHAIVAGFQSQAAAGKMPIEEAQKAAREALRVSRYGGADGKADHFYIWSLDGKGVLHPIKPEWEGQEMVGKIKDGAGRDIIKMLLDGMTASKDGRAYVETLFPRPGKTEAVPNLHYVVKVDGWNWMVGSGLYTDDVDAAVAQQALADAGVVLLLLVVIGGLGWTVARSVVRQIGGEPGEATSAIADVAQGNLTARVHSAPKGSLIHGLSEMVDALRGTVLEVRQSAQSIQAASSEVATGNQDLSRRTEQTASNLQQSASSIEELSATVNQTADSARTANQLASSASAVARRGGEVVSQVVATMEEINTSSKKIADIIGTIDGIAFQTNILALNAAVEAARAGEQGRGFAVVASEVRSLAGRSAEAAREIKSLIGASVEKVESGSRLVQDAGSTMNEIVASVQRVTDIISEISAAASEQSAGIGLVNSSVAQLDQMTQQNAALVEESAAAAESLREQAQRLAGTVSRFRFDNGTASGTKAAPAATPAKLAARVLQQAAAPKTVAAPPKAAAPKALAAKPAPVTKQLPATAAAAPTAKAGDDGDWASF